MFLRIVGVVVLLFAILAGVLAFNTFTYTSEQIEVEPVEKVALNAEAAAERLAKAVTFRTISHQDPAEFRPEPFIAFREYLEELYPRVHQELERELVSDYSLLYTWEGTDTELAPVVLLAHFDVVPVAPGTESLWIKDAYEHVIEDGYIWGRGTLDDKVNVLAMLESVEILLGEGFTPARTFIFAFGHDEEIGGNLGAVKMAEMLKERGVRAWFVLDEGGAITRGVLAGLDADVATIGIAEKGYMSVELTATAQGGHSSQPPKETAIGILARAVDAVQSSPMPANIEGVSREMLARIGPEMPPMERVIMANLWLFEPMVIGLFEAGPATNAMIRTTTAPTMFNAGVKDNVLPAEATAVINFRLLPGDTVESVLEHVRRAVNDERVSIEPMEWASGASNVSDPKSETFQMIEKTIRQTFPGTLVAPYLVLGGTDSRHYEIISDEVYRFSPTILNAEDLTRIHGVNERVGVENYTDIIRFYHQLIQNTG